MIAQEIYQIRVKGHLGQCWKQWFDGLTITNVEQGEAVLSGPLPDQAALHGVLMKIRDMGLPLLAVNRVVSHDPEKGREEGEQHYDCGPNGDNNKMQL
jgi:hypothetical protein